LKFSKNIKHPVSRRKISTILIVFFFNFKLFFIAVKEKNRIGYEKKIFSPHLLNKYIYV